MRKSMKLGDLVEIIIPKAIQKKEVGEKILFANKDDFSKVGFSTVFKNSVNTNTKIDKKYYLKPFDILVSSCGIPFRIAIVGSVDKNIIPTRTMYILRFKDNENLQKNAIALYMYLKSNKAQNILDTLSQGKLQRINKTKLQDALEKENNKNIIDKINEIIKVKEMKTNLSKTIKRDIDSIDSWWPDEN